MRASLAVFLILAGAIFTFPASLAFWEQRVLMNEDRFVSLGNDILEREAVQDALAPRVAAEAERFGVPAEASRFLAAGLVRQLPDSPIADDALKSAHALLRRLIRDDAVRPENESIILDLRPVVERVVLDASLTAPTFELPPDAGQIVLVRETDLAPAFTVARRFDAAALYIALLPLLIFALALAVAPSRAAALFGIGLVVALTAGFRIFLIERPLASVFTEAALLDPTAGAATDQSYDAIAATFIQQEWIFVVMGLAMVIASVVLAVVTRWLPSD